MNAIAIATLSSVGPISIALLSIALILLFFSPFLRKLQLEKLALRYSAMSLAIWPFVGIVPGALIYRLDGDKTGIVACVAGSFLVAADMTLVTTSRHSPTVWGFLSLSVFLALALLFVTRRQKED